MLEITSIWKVAEISDKEAQQVSSIRVSKKLEREIFAGSEGLGAGSPQLQQ